MNLKKHQRILFAISTGVLMSLPWLQIGMGYVLLFAFVPYLFLEDFVTENKAKISKMRMFNLSYISMFIWNLLSLWWISYATFGGAVGAIIVNSFLFAIILFLFHFIKRTAGKRLGYISFVLFWLSFEYLHLNWEISWPWLMLGNAFGGNIHIIQWYEYTGVLGGTAWILISNLSIFVLLKNIIERKKNKSQLIQTSLIVLVPIIISISIFHTYKEKINPKNIVVVQPNIDPYNDKFGGMSPKDQLTQLLNLVKTKIETNTDFIVGPETALVRNLWEEKINESPEYLTIKSFLSNYPKAKFVVGLSSLREYKNGDIIPETARKFVDTTVFYDSYNSAMQVDSSRKIQLYHKSQLVIGVEKIPFPSILNKFALDLGGTVGSLGIQKERSVFSSTNDTIKIAPIICYESVYGEFVSEFVKNGANFIFIITNDGWWEDTPGYKHHLSYASIRAIETRRSIARSANTGISCFVNQRGEISQATEWWKADVISGTINSNDKLTLYIIFGDYIGRLSSFISVLILLIAIVLTLKRNKSKLRQS